MATAQIEDRPPPGRERALEVPMAPAPRIDGELDDEVWARAAVADRFWVSATQTWPGEQTEVFVLQDGRHLYFGFKCFDSKPDEVQAIQTRRDANFAFDDYVVVELDTFRDHRTVSTYSVNALGTQADAIAGGRARKIEWKGDWYAAVARTDYGWSAEIAIPLDILNYRDEDQSFNINFLRHHHRTREWSQWADVTPQNKREEMGTLTELVLPAQSAAGSWTFMPYLFAGRNIPDERGEVQESLTTGGIDVRYTPRPDLTGMLSLNPDFSQVETQVTDIDFSYTEKFIADARPFFQEGAASFGDDALYFYSNRVPDFDEGAKAFGRIGRLQYGALVTDAFDGRNDAIVRFGHDFASTHFAGLMWVYSDRLELKNQIWLAQLNGRAASGFHYALDTAASRTEGQPGDGEAARGVLGWRSDWVAVGTAIDRYDVHFFPANGLIKQDLPGTEGARPYVSYAREFTAGFARAITADLAWTARDTADGRVQTRNWYAGGTIELWQQIRFGLQYYNGEYRPPGSEPGEWSPQLNQDRYAAFAVDLNTRSNWLGYGAWVSGGQLGGGDYDYLLGYFWTRPTATTFVKLTSEKLESFGTFRQTVLTTGWDVSARDSIAARYIAATAGDATRFAYRRQVRSGIDVFAVYDRFDTGPKKVSLKLVLTF